MAVQVPLPFLCSPTTHYACGTRNSVQIKHREKTPVNSQVY